MLSKIFDALVAIFAVAFAAGALVIGFLFMVAAMILAVIIAYPLSTIALVLLGIWIF